MRQRGAPAPDPKAAAGARCRLKPGYTCQTQDIAGPAGDICDLYAFPSLERSDHLVLVLNVLPRATSDSHFSDAIVYRFRLRPITIAGVGGATAFPFARRGLRARLHLPVRDSRARWSWRGTGAGRPVPRTVR